MREENILLRAQKRVGYEVDMINEKLILLVEDNPDDVLLTERALKKSRIANRLVVAKDGVEALDFLFYRGAYANLDRNRNPEVVLLDLKLPRIDGLEVLKQIRSNERTRFIPVIILTSSLEEKDLLSGYQLGANSYIRKPVDFNQFVEAVQQLEMYWLVLNQIPPDTCGRKRPNGETIKSSNN
jgi:two-component system response regulator